MAKAYYGSRISENMTKTPEGFLICHNVPIARTGTQQYLAKEINTKHEGNGEDVVMVYRLPEEVFGKATIASFEGKVFTDEHPNNWVNYDNAGIYTKGVATNVRRGKDDEDDLLLADIIVYDKQVVDKILGDVGTKKREISCGYECNYVEYKDGYKQTNIIGNHVSLVNAARAGERVAIKDSFDENKINIERRKYSMANYKLPSKKPTSNITDFLKAVGLKAVVQDSEPEDILDVVDELAMEKNKATKDSEEAEQPVVKAEFEAEAEDEGVDLNELEAKIDRALELINGLIEGGTEDEEVEELEDEDEDDSLRELDELEEELEDEVEDYDQMEEEESVTVDPEDIEMDEDPLYDGEEVLEKATDAALNLLRQFKPIVAAIPDARERRKATDALVKQVRKVSKEKTNTYAIMNSRKAQDSIVDEDKSGLGLDIAKKYNPHYKQSK